MDGRRHVRELTKKHQPSMVVLMETHCPFNRAERFWHHTGFKIAACSEANGHSGGIWVLVEKNSNFRVELVDSFHQVVTVRVSRSSRHWTFSAVYASPIPAARKNLWHHLIGLKSTISDPWLLMGDFNEVLYQSKVRGGSFSMNRASKFSHMMETCELLDLGAKGNLFTWFCKAVGERAISKRLDRGMSDYNWRTTFHEAFVENLVRQHSDHSPLLLRCKSIIPDKGARPFRFQVAWLSHKQFPPLVQNAWKKGNHIVPFSLNKVKEEALDFNQKIFGNIFQRKHTLEARLKGIQRSLESVDDLRLTLLEKDLQKDYNDVLKQEELLWYQKSREKWVRLGDRNTGFFHAQTIMRRRRNKLHGIFLRNGNWCTDPDTLKDETLHFFKELFTSTMASDQTSFQVPLIPALNHNGFSYLTAPVSLDEVRKAVFSMKSSKLRVRMAFSRSSLNTSGMWCTWIFGS